MQLGDARSHALSSIGRYFILEKILHFTKHQDF